MARYNIGDTIRFNLSYIDDTGSPATVTPIAFKYIILPSRIEGTATPSEMADDKGLPFYRVEIAPTVSGTLHFMWTAGSPGVTVEEGAIKIYRSAFETNCTSDYE